MMPREVVYSFREHTMTINPVLSAKSRVVLRCLTVAVRIFCVPVVRGSYSYLSRRMR